MQTTPPSLVHGVQSPLVGVVVFGVEGCSGAALGAGCTAGAEGFAAGGVG
jgi:hypothetical protein